MTIGKAHHYLLTFYQRRIFIFELSVYKCWRRCELLDGCISEKNINWLEKIIKNKLTGATEYIRAPFVTILGIYQPTYSFQHPKIIEF